jgi:hypothetical protein
MIRTHEEQVTSARHKSRTQENGTVREKGLQDEQDNRGPGHKRSSTHTRNRIEHEHNTRKAGHNRRTGHKKTKTLRRSRIKREQGSREPG